MFEKTLTDVVKGIRSSRRDTSLYISQCIAEIKTEINSSDMFVKANALQKLTFLQMMGYGMSWASFASIELMSSPRFAHKRIAYLAASQGFTQDTDVILLTTNLLKKELRGGVYEAGLAINCISNIVTEDLARDLLPELTSLTNHPQPYLRKKAILCLFKLFVKYPQGLRLTFGKIQQCLDDPNPSVVSCAVNVITELSDKNPKNYLHLAPSFFQLLTTSSNNWMLIKVVKLLGSLVPEEPRLARKLLEPLAEIVRNTKAKSLLYEAVHTITLCLPYCRRSDGTMPAVVPEIVTLCAETLQGFVNETDQNLKYLGLVGFASLMQSHPRVLSAPGYRPIILACLSDQDVTIRTRALSLLSGMASRKNLIELVTQLLSHVELATGGYKLDLVSKIIEMCTSEKYTLLSDFEWYLNVLFQLGHMRGLDAHSKLLQTQIFDVALRVLPVRVFAVRRSIEILLERDGVPSSDPYGDNGRGRHIMPEILPAIAWIVGEYSDLIRKSLSLTEGGGGGEDFFLDDKSKGTYHSLIQTFTSSSNFQRFPPDTQKIYLHAALKVFAAATADSKISDKELEASCETLRQNLPLYLQSVDVEVQERAFTAHALLLSMGLISGRNSVPPLEALDSEDSDSEGGGNADIGGLDGDLLGMNTGKESQKAVDPMIALSSQPLSQAKTSLSAKCRKSGSVLNYVFKPSPMKPIGAKAQRKKSQSPVGIDISEVDAVDLDVFSFLCSDEVSMSGSRYSLESVSFTQQTPVRTPDVPTANVMSSDALGSSAVSGGRVISSFQQPAATDAVEASGSGLRLNQNDPFYLASAPKTKPNDGRDIGQFGMIQLSDSDDGVTESSNKRKNKKKKKKERKTIDPLEHISSGVAVYDSDDEPENRLHYKSAPPRSKGKKGPGKEFESLAKVDLTEPLREDEVMPERKHRVVPNTNQNPGGPFTAEKPSKKDKKEKKTKKESKKESKKKRKEKVGYNVSGEPTSNVGDLLELGGFGGAPAQPAPAQASFSIAAPPTPPSQSTASNAISDAFGDLLGFETPSLPQQQTSFFNPLPLIAAPSDSLPWIKANVKSSKVAGSGPDLDFSTVIVEFKVYRAESVQGTAAMLVLRVRNSGSAVLRSVTIQIKEVGSVALGDISPNAYADSNKIGPVSYGEVDIGFDLKGSLSASGATLSVKFGMPVSLHLHPWQGLTIEDVGNELSSQNMDSRALKINFSPTTTQHSIRTMLSSFLQSAEIEVGSSRGSGFNGTLAAQSIGGARLLILYKVKDGIVKIDLKCTDKSFAKALMKSLEKLVL